MTEPAYADHMVTIYQGDVLDRLRDLADESVQCCVTSPPYWGLRDYGAEGQIGLETTPAEYVAALTTVFAEVRRVLRDDGTLWLNLGDCYTSGNRTTRDDDVKLSARAMSRRAPVPGGLKPKDLVGIPWMVAFALRADGWYLRKDIIWHKPNAMPESVTDRPTSSHEYLFLLSKRLRYYYDHIAIREPDAGTDHPRRILDGQASLEPSGGLSGVHSGIRTTEGRNGKGRNGKGRNRRSVWTIATRPYLGAHFATFPEALVEPCILAGTKVGDTVLDPFAGSGTTLAVAKRLDRGGVGIELNPDYAELAARRCRRSTVAPFLPIAPSPRQIADAGEARR